mmetsp:Transcript_31053/g.85029  ORF Transcript_31053/g.85029 Transcript_31053/m.85029 type:complete len:229 (-) Transcript_31053:9-695(-)
MRVPMQASNPPLRSYNLSSSPAQCQTSMRMPGFVLWLNLSTNLTPLIMSPLTIPSPTIPRTILFQTSSMVPPPSSGFSWTWKWPPSAFSGLSHSGRMPFRKIINDSITVLDSAFCLKNFFPFKSSLGCGRCFQHSQNFLTVSTTTTSRVASVYCAFESRPRCSQMVHAQLSLGSFRLIRATSAALGVGPRSGSGVMSGLRLMKGTSSTTAMSARHGDVYSPRASPICP